MGVRYIYARVMSPVHEQYQLPADQPLNLDVALDLF